MRRAVNVLLVCGLGGALLMEGSLNAEASPPAALDGARQRWAEHGPEDYRYTLQRQCYCPAEARVPLRVTVRDGRVTRVVAAEDGARPSASLKDLARSIDAWLDFVEKARNAGYARVEVTFHRQLGYPTKIIIDKDERMVDEELRYTLKALDPL